MVVVELTSVELMMAAEVAKVRRFTSIQRGYDANKHAEKSDLQTDFVGAAAELAFAKTNNWYWGGTNCSFKQADVGVWQVRGTEHRNGHLIVRPNDEKPDEQFVLAITSINEKKVAIIGWMTAGNAKVDKYWRQDENGWWVPQGDVKPINGPFA